MKDCSENLRNAGTVASERSDTGLSLASKAHGELSRIFSVFLDTPAKIGTATGAVHDELYPVQSTHTPEAVPFLLFPGL